MNPESIVRVDKLPLATLRPVAVLGTDAVAMVLAQTMALRGHDVRVWCRDEETADAINEFRKAPAECPLDLLDERVVADTTAAQCVEGAEIVLFSLPVAELRAVCPQVAQVLRPDQIALHAIRGMEQRTALRVSEILMEETCLRQIGVLSGPNAVAEMLDGKPSGIVVGTRFPRVAESAYRLFTNEGTRVYHNDDIVGVEVIGALLSCLSIGVGVVIGLGLGENTVGLMMTRGLQELIRIGNSMGVRASTFAGVSTIGQLTNAIMQQESREVEFGLGLAAGKTTHELLSETTQVIDGVVNCVVAWEYARDHQIYCPILSSIYGCVHGGRSPIRAMRDLMAVQYMNDVNVT